MQQGFIKYIVIIIIILGIVFLSQQAYIRGFGKTLISAVADQGGAYLAKGSNWAAFAVLPKISGEVQSGGETITTATNQAKKIPENILTKVGNYFSGIEKAIVNPWTPQNCFSSVQTPSLNP